MSLIKVSYTPQFTSSFLGSSPFICHRVCYRFGSSGSYCCINDNTDSIAGVPKIFTITVGGSPPCGSVPSVDPQACNGSTYEGYVQACCEAVTSLNGRAPWSATFVASPDCVNKLVCCVSKVGLSATHFSITQAGTAYGAGPISVVIVRDPADTIAAGVGNDAVVVANITAGTVTSFTVSTAGSYSKTPLVVIPSPGGSGTQARAVLVIPCTSTSRYKGNCVDGTTLANNMVLGQCVDYCFPKAHPFFYLSSILSGDPDTGNFTYTTQGCCDCTTCHGYNVQISSNLATVTICYTRCKTTSFGQAIQICITSPPTPGSGTLNIACAVPGSIYCSNDPTAIIAITQTASACPQC